MSLPATSSVDLIDKLGSFKKAQNSTTSLREAAWKAALENFSHKSFKQKYALVRTISLEESNKPQEETFSSKADILIANGKLAFSQPHLKLIDLASALQIGSLAKDHYSKLTSEEKDPWLQVSGALADPLWLKLATNYEGTLNIEYRNTSAASASFPALTLWIAENSRLEINVTSTGSGQSLSVESLSLHLEKDAQVNMTWQRRQAKESNTLYFLRSGLKRGSNFKFTDLSTGAKICRLDAHVKLLEEGCECSLNGLGLLEQTSHSYTDALIEHAAINCVSSQLFKNALKGTSRSLFQGKIYVHPVAQGTSAYQLSRNLILEPGAVAESKPNLEIFADDVKASHGSATGEVDPEALFYLMARGIDSKTAKALLVHGFSLEVISSLKESDLKREWKCKVDNF